MTILMLNWKMASVCALTIHAALVHFYGWMVIWNPMNYYAIWARNRCPMNLPQTIFTTVHGTEGGHQELHHEWSCGRGCRQYLCLGGPVYGRYPPATRCRPNFQARYEGLVAAIWDVLERAIRRGGTTLRDFVNSDGAPGYFAQELLVYDRAGGDCFQCGEPSAKSHRSALKLLLPRMPALIENSGESQSNWISL